MTDMHTKPLDENLSFEFLLGELSSELVNLTFESIDEAIESSLKKLVEFFDADRCHLGELLPDQSKIVVPYFYSRPGLNIPQIADIGEHYLSFIYENIKKDKLIAFSKTSELPKQASQDCTVIDNMGIKSLLVIPLKIDKAVQFALSLSTVENHRQWSEETIRQTKIVANILAHVIQRKIILKQIAEEKEWSEAVMDGMPQLAYVMNLEGRLIRWNKNYQDFTGYSAEELKDKYPRDFLSDEDYKKVMTEIQKIIEDGQERSVEYDIIVKGGKIIPSYYGSGKLLKIGGESFIIGQTVDISKMKQAQSKIATQLEEIKTLKDQLEVENIYLRQELKSSHSFDEIIGESDILKHILYRVEQVAPIDTTVLLEGETGTGKELFARAIHQRSNRNNKPLITVNCASMPVNLIESELFGHEKGAFTGALQKQMGRFELADGGTIFLDEVGEIPIELQAKLLRVLQDGEFERIGNPNKNKVDVRVIAATNRNLEQEILHGRFRKDLYYRLNVYPITIVPLRERKNDIPLLVEHFVQRFNKKFGKNIKRIPKKVIEHLRKYDWPGNIRELENVIERAVILSKSSTLSIGQLRTPVFAAKEKLNTLVEQERSHIEEVLNSTLWRIEGPNGAAQILDINPGTLRSRMKKLGLKRPAASK
ncbi:MAG: sigma 54-interacting transcriptional regulator [Ignavibacteriaceae bacterium]|nr:sigma 54-interacting transcriptional regulator [Ignavibacteriaceae bacterium]